MSKCVICGEEIPENFTVLYLFGNGDIACLKHENTKQLLDFLRALEGKKPTLPFECQSCTMSKLCYSKDHTTSCRNLNLNIKEALENEV